MKAAETIPARSSCTFKDNVLAFLSVYWDTSHLMTIQAASFGLTMYQSYDHLFISLSVYKMGMKISIPQGYQE